MADDESERGLISLADILAEQDGPDWRHKWADRLAALAGVPPRPPRIDGDEPDDYSWRDD